MHLIDWPLLASLMNFDSEVSMLTTMYETQSTQQIADKLGVDKKTINYRLTKLGIALRPVGGMNNYRHGRYVGDYAKRQLNSSIL